MWRRVFAVGATAAVGVVPSAWCAPKKREGLDDQGRLRYDSQHLNIFGPGYHLDVYMKAKVVQMWENSQKFYEEREQRKKMPTIHNFFRNITGFGHQRVGEYKAEIEKNQGFLVPPDQRGRQIYMLESDYPGFERWVDGQALKAMSGYLTVDNLLPKFQEEFGVVISYHVLRKALLRLDFTYSKRERAYVSNKWKPDVLEMLKVHVALVHGKIAFNGTRWYFRNPTAWEDEAYMLAGEMRSMSWIRQQSKYRNVLRGGNKRWCMVGTIFSHNPEGVKGVLKHWNMGTKKEKDGRPYWGKMDSELAKKYFGQEVMPHLGQSDVSPTLFLDNWSVHKKFEEDFGKTRESRSEWMWRFLEEEKFAKNSDLYKAWASLYVSLGGDPSAEATMAFVKKHRVPVRQLEKLAYSYNVQLRYLAPYWSPTNPVEFVWARLKQLIRDADPKVPLDERIDKAWEQIDHDFILACIDRSIRFCLAWHARFRGAGMSNHAVGADSIACVRKIQFGPIEPESEDEGCDSDSEDEEEDSEQLFKRFKA